MVGDERSGLTSVASRQPVQGAEAFRHEATVRDRLARCEQRNDYGHRMDDDLVRVGALRVPLGTARTWLRDYFDEDSNRRSTRPFAFPAYEAFDTGSTPETLNDGDLLAPALLNVQPSLAAFY